MAKKRKIKEYQIHVCNQCSRLRSVEQGEIVLPCEGCGGTLRLIGQELPFGNKCDKNHISVKCNADSNYIGEQQIFTPHGNKSKP